jgi:hypothetical protein
MTDQRNLDLALSNEPLTAEWRPDLLGCIMAIVGKWQDGAPMLAVPNYARMNRVTENRSEIALDSAVNYSRGTTIHNSNNKEKPEPAGSSLQGTTIPKNSTERTPGQPKIESKVWIRSLA